MPTPLLHEGYPVQIVYAGPTTMYLNDLASIETNPGIESLEQMASGSTTRAFVSDVFADNKVSLTSHDVATILGAISFHNGLIFTSALVQYQKRLNGGTYTSGANHITLSATGGLLYPKEINVKQDDKEGATLSLDICPTWDGTNLPFVVNASQNLAGSVAANSIHALGPVIFEGAQLGGVQSVSVKSGIEVMVKRQDGERHSRIVVIVAQKPTIEIEVLNVPFAGTLTLGGTYPISTGITVYLQKCVSGGGRVAVGTAEHISFNTSAGSYRLDSVSGSRGENANLKFTVIPTGTLTMSAAAAIVIP